MQEKVLESIKQSLTNNKLNLQEAAETILENGISKFPVFVFYKGNFALGEQIIESKPEMPWRINATTAEDMIKKGLIPYDKAKYFIANYKNPQKYFCLFVVQDQKNAGFIFTPIG